MPYSFQSTITKTVTYLVVIAPCVFFLLFENGRALADRPLLQIVERPSNPRTKYRPKPKKAHALVSAEKPSYSNSAKQDTDSKVEEYLFEGNSARDDGKFDEADTQYNLALKLDLKEWRAHYGLANVLYDRAVLNRQSNQPLVDFNKFTSKAVREYESAVELSRSQKVDDKELSDLYSDLSQAYLLSNLDERIPRARDAVDEALRLDPESASANRRSGKIFDTELKDKEALEMYSKSLKLDSKNVFIHLNLAGIHNRQFNNNKKLTGSRDIAIREFQEVIRLSPEFIPGYEGLGQMYFEKFEYKDAIQPFKKAVELLSQLANDRPDLKPRLAIARHKLALSYFRSEDSTSARQGAQRELEELRKIDPEQAKVLEREMQK